MRNINCLILLLMLFSAAAAAAEESLSSSGRIGLRGIQPIEGDSVREQPNIEGRFKLDASASGWVFHSWLEGGWDGSVRRPIRDNDLFKNYDQVYQRSTPYLEFKELFLSHTLDDLELRGGIQRFAWGRLDEYPPNDLLNPWDYSQFLRKPLEERKIGVPSLSATVNTGDWGVDGVWVPVFVPYRLPLPYERWSGSSLAAIIGQAAPNAEIVPREGALPGRTVENGGTGLRVKHAGTIEWALNLLHGYDPRPVFRTTALSIVPAGGSIVIDPGYVPDFHKISSVGVDAAVVRGDLSLRAEAAYSFNRYLNIRRELWGYPAVLSPGIYRLNPVIEQKHDTLDYGIGADYRVFEDVMLIVQAQQTITLGNVELLYERKAETLLWLNLKATFMNQKIETNSTLAYNPEHGGRMTKANLWYVFSDAWKAGLTYVALTGPDQSIFGRYSRNDQGEAEVIYSW